MWVKIKEDLAINLDHFDRLSIDSIEITDGKRDTSEWMITAHRPPQMPAQQGTHGESEFPRFPLCRFITKEEAVERLKGLMTKIGSA